MTKPDLLPCPYISPLFGVGDIVTVIGEYESDWHGQKLMITGVEYFPKQKVIKYQTHPADDPTSEGGTDEWPEEDLSMYQRNKWNTRAPTKSAEVDLGALRLEIEALRPPNNYTHGYTSGYMSGKWDAFDKVKGHLATGKGGDEHPDDIAVNKFAAAMKEKMAKKRAQGYGGWNDNDECSVERLNYLLRTHVEKGDPIDVGNFCMMLFNRGERTEQQKTAEPCGDDREAYITVLGADCTINGHYIVRDKIDHTPLAYVADLRHANLLVSALKQPAAPTQIDAGDLEAVDIQKAIAALEIAIGYPAMVSKGIGNMPVLKDRAADDCRIIGEVINLLEAHLSKLAGGGK